ncbi:MAG: HD domain-containing protein [Alphaproteobacteria bacterium]|jgi:HD-GYP domain-containing protein (c-di-GMP phosphodiesterase class II)|nr:HD domain-containing protein [Alphaproteobacteria bacterium]MBT4016416.1 HD domain-containing protein [Alphaproteobacteria bacterium]MBT4965406.1 HD domain-containing protein [Alphaproteobacteria bacterium]MBT5160309.1 HD domain-containing protein [Alphaproteobacteria bacterium]MBT6385217.1 HD domain-containing protein [Alphaproteobacteria bacterium]
MKQNTGKATGPVSVSLFGMMTSLSAALDLINPALNDHHKLTCYIACSIAGELDMPENEYNDMFMAAVLHDIGAIAVADRLKLLEYEEKSPHLHAELGKILVSGFPPFAGFAPIIQFHHVDWNDGEGQQFQGIDVPEASHIIHLADRVAVLIDKSKPVFSQVEEIRQIISDSEGSRFVPAFVEAFMTVSRKEAFWLDMYFAPLDKKLNDLSRLPEIKLDLDDLAELSRFFAIIIDTRSSFTAFHTSGVAACSRELAELCGMSPTDCQKVLIAGYLHDLGKLAVPNEILEKNGKLNLEEWRVIQAHTYHTQRILESIEGIEEIADWASHHHESLSGDGYPFRLAEEELPLGSRIVMVADIFTALTEDRPYRKGMKRDEIEKIFEELLAGNKVDAGIVNILHTNYARVDRVCKEAQSKSSVNVSEFWEKSQQSVELIDSEAATG